MLEIKEPEKVILDIYCGCYIHPIDSRNPEGEECNWGTELVIEKYLWEDGFVCWCPECHAELTNGFGIRLMKGE